MSYVNAIDYLVNSGDDLYTQFFRSLDKKRLDKDELTRQYKQMSRKYHPDKNLGNEDVAKEMFQQLSTAYEILNDDNLRSQYDFKWKHRYQPAAAAAAPAAAPAAPAAAPAPDRAPSSGMFGDPDFAGMFGEPAKKNPVRFAHSNYSIHNLLKKQMEDELEQKQKQRPQLAAPPPRSMFNSPGGIEGSVTFGSMRTQYPPGGSGMGGYKKRKYYSYNRRSNKRLNKKSSKNKRHAMKRRGYNSYKIKKQ